MLSSLMRAQADRNVITEVVQMWQLLCFVCCMSFVFSGDGKGHQAV